MERRCRRSLSTGTSGILLGQGAARLQTNRRGLQPLRPARTPEHGAPGGGAWRRHLGAGVSLCAIAALCPRIPAASSNDVRGLGDRNPCAAYAPISPRP
jgi:hypothetical protein